MSQAVRGWPPGSRSRTEHLGDGTVSLTEYGDGDGDNATVMVCLHGLGGSGLNFGLAAPLLARRRRVLVPDLLAHGRSSTPDRSQGALAAQLQMLGELLRAVHP